MARNVDSGLLQVLQIVFNAKGAASLLLIFVANKVKKKNVESLLKAKLLARLKCAS